MKTAEPTDVNAASMALSPISATLPPSYVYKPLPTSPATIRLLKLHDEISSFDDPILCEIHHVNLDSAMGYEYTGLSYVWGEPIFDQTIHCDGCLLKVTCHLHGAIQRLRSRRVSWVWIDAICIDQSNIAERNAQVSIMGRIFKQTQMTYAYLGKIDENGEKVAGLTIRLAFLDFLLRDRSPRDLQLLRDTDSDDLVLKKALQNHPCASERERIWFGQWRHYCMAIFELRRFINPKETDQVLQVLGLPLLDSCLWLRYADLYKLPWFGRGWVIQEAVLSPHVRFLLGRDTVELDDMAQSYWFSISSGLASTAIPFDGAFQHIPCEIMECRVKQESRELKQLLRTFRPCETTDPRDKMYSLLGLAEDLGMTAPKPDYHQSAEVVFSSYARYLIQQQHQSNIDILLDAGIARGSTERSGTWVPQWDESLQPTLLFPGPSFFNASGSAKSVFSFGTRSSLIVRGVLWDKAGQLRVKISVNESWYTWERKVLNMVHKSPRFSTEVYAKALVADCWGQGMNHFGGPSGLTFTDLYEDNLLGHGLLTDRRRYMAIGANLTKTSAFALTHKGNMGWIPRCSVESDLICIVFGLQMPLVIRETGHGKYILIGAAYIEGIMYGEAFEETNVEGQDIMFV